MTQRFDSEPLTELQKLENAAQDSGFNVGLGEPIDMTVRPSHEIRTLEATRQKISGGGLSGSRPFAERTEDSLRAFKPIKDRAVQNFMNAVVVDNQRAVELLKMDPDLRFGSGTKMEKRNFVESLNRMEVHTKETLGFPAFGFYWMLVGFSDTLYPHSVQYVVQRDHHDKMWHDLSWYDDAHIAAMDSPWVEKPRHSGRADLYVALAQEVMELLTTVDPDQHKDVVAKMRDELKMAAKAGYAFEMENTVTYEGIVAAAMKKTWDEGKKKEEPLLDWASVDKGDAGSVGTSALISAISSDSEQADPLLTMPKFTLAKKETKAESQAPSSYKFESRKGKEKKTRSEESLVSGASERAQEKEDLSLRKLVADLKKEVYALQAKCNKHETTINLLMGQLQTMQISLNQVAGTAFVSGPQAPADTSNIVENAPAASSSGSNIVEPAVSVVESSAPAKAWSMPSSNRRL